LKGEIYAVLVIFSNEVILKGKICLPEFNDSNEYEFYSTVLA